MKQLTKRAENVHIGIWVLIGFCELHLQALGSS